MEESSLPLSSSPQDLAAGYDPASQLDDIFGGSDSSDDEGSDPVGSSQQDPADSTSIPTANPAPGGSEATQSSTEVVADPAGSGVEAQGEDTEPDADSPAATPAEPERDSSAPAGAESESMVDRLTETLRAAQGPPAQADFIAAMAPAPGSSTVPSYSQGPEETQLIRIGGTAPGSYDQINVTGAANFDGTLKIQLVNGFIPSAGDSFTLFTWGSHTGEFANWLGTAGIPGHPDLAFEPTYSAGDPGSLTLTVVSTPIVIPGVQPALTSGLTTLSNVAGLLQGVGSFTQGIPLIGDSLSDLVDFGNAVSQTLRDQLQSLFMSSPKESEVTSAIEGWDGDTFGAGSFTVKVNGVRGHYGVPLTDPFSWEVNLEISPTAVDRFIQDLTGGVFGAVFNPNPAVSVHSALVLDVSFGYDTDFFVQVDGIKAKAEVDVSGLSGFNLDTSLASLAVTNGSIDLAASVTATPDDSILTGGKITLGTLSSLGAGNIGDAFNLDEAGTLDASLTLAGNLALGPAVQYNGLHTAEIHSTDLFSGADPDLTIQVVGSLNVLNQTLSGTFLMRKTATETLIEVSNGELSLTLGPTLVLRADNGSGKFLLLGDDLAGTATLTIAEGPAVPGLTISGTTLTLAFNSSPQAVPTIDGVAVNLPAGDFYRVSGHAVIGLAIPDVDLTGDFVFEPHDTDLNPANGDEEVVVGVANLSFHFDGVGLVLLDVSSGSGVFVINDDGIAGTLTVDVDLHVPAVSLGGTFSVALNTTNAIVTARDVNVNGVTVRLSLDPLSLVNLPAGPYLRVRGQDVQLTVLGIALTGDFSFEQKTTGPPGGEKVVTVAASDVHFDLGSAANDLVNVTLTSGAFIFRDDGLAGEADATAMLGVPNVGLTGALKVRINTIEGVAVDEMVDVGGTTVHIATPAGPYLQVNGDHIKLTLLGVELLGNFSFEQRNTVGGTQLVRVVASDVSFDFGTSVVTASNGQALFLINDSGMAGQGSITVTVSALGGSFAQPLSWSFNNTAGPIDETIDNTPVGMAKAAKKMAVPLPDPGSLEDFDLPEGPFNRLSTGGPVPLMVNIAGQPQGITAAVVLTLVDAPGADPDYVTVGVSQFSMTLGTPSFGIDVAQGTGAFVIYTTGVAGEVTVAMATLNGAGVLGLNAQNLKVRFNNTGNDVGSPNPVVVSISDNPADNVSLQFIGLPYRNYLALEGTAEITGLTGNVTLGATFSFEKTSVDTNGDMVPEDVFKVGAADLHFALKAGSLSIVSFHHGTGAFVITPDGVAGVADLEFEVGLVGLAGDIGLQVNTTNAAVNTTVTVGGTPTAINVADTHIVRVTVNGTLLLGSIGLPFNLVVEIDTGTSTVVFKDAPPSNTELLRIDSNGNIDTDLSFSDFARPGPFEFVSMLRQLMVWIQAFRDSDLFDVEIPFTNGTTLGDTFDWTKLFLDEIYKNLVSVELQSRSIRTVDPTTGDPTTVTGNLTAAKFMIQVGTDPPQEVVMTGPYASVADLVSLFNAARPAALVGKVIARINHDDQFVIALEPDLIAAQADLKLVDLNDEAQNLGFGPHDTVYGDVGDTTAEQVGVETALHDTEDFFEAVRQVVAPMAPPIVYDAARRVYTFEVNESATYHLPVPFSFGADLGPIASAQLSGMLDLAAAIGFHFTLGFDLGAREVPRILTSSLIPSPANGRISADAHFQIQLNDDLSWVDLVLPKSYTDGTDLSDPMINNSLTDLEHDLNRVLHETFRNGTRLDQLLVAQKAGTGLAISALQEEDEDHDGLPDAGKDLNMDGNLDQQLGIINRIVIRSHTDDVFATELGFGVEVEDFDNNPATLGDRYFLSASNSTIKGLFIEDVGLTAELTVTTPTPISGSLRFGFIEITTSGGEVGTLDYNGAPNPLSATISLEDQATGEDRFYISDLFNSISSDHLGQMIQGPDFHGSFLARLDNISVGGLGFSFPLGADPEISLFIPDINHLQYNANPYNGSNTGLFLTYPNLGDLQNFTSLNFTQIIKALKVIADNLGQLSAFSFLDERLPFIDLSVNDMIDYAVKFADLIDAAAGGNAQSLQETLRELEDQIEQLFNLNPDVLTVSLDDGGLSGLSVTTSGGVNGSTHSTATLNPAGDDNGVTLRTTSLASAASRNGSIIRYVADPTVLGSGAVAMWDSSAKILTIKINSGHTNASAVVAAVNGLAGMPWTASLFSPDNGSSGNTGTGPITTSAFVTTGGVNNASPSAVTLMPGGDNNDIRISTNPANLANASGWNGTVVRLLGDNSVTGANALVSWDLNAKVLTIKINPGQTTANAIIDAINNASTPWNAALAPPDNSSNGNTGEGPITTSALKFRFVFQTAYADSLPFQLDLKKLVSQLAGDNNAVRAFLEAATTLIQVQGSGNLTVSASAALTLDFGLDVSNPAKVRPFFYDTTGVELLAKVLGTDINIEASLGSIVGIFIKDATLTLDRDGDPETDAGDGDRGAEFRLGLKDNNGDGRHYFDEDWFNGGSIDLHLTGGVRATLPIFAPLESTPLDGDTDDNGDGYPDNQLVIDIPDLVRLFQSELVMTDADGASATVLFGGNNNDLVITSTSATNYHIQFLDTLSGGMADADFNAGTNTLTVHLDTGNTTAQTVLDAIQSVTGFATSALTADDDGNDATTSNDGTGKLERLFIATPDFGALFDNLDLCEVIASQTGLLLDGLDSLLGSIQDGLNAIVLNANLPLIGDGLAGAANFIEDFREGLLASLRKEVEEAGGNGLTALENAIKKAFWSTLGPEGLDLLVNPDTGADLDPSLGYSQLAVTIDCDTGLLVRLRLRKVAALVDTAVAFDIGVPGFGLEVDGGVQVKVGFDLKFGFGINKEDGFFFDSSAPEDDPELRVFFEASIPALHAAGQLLFLQLDVMDDAEDPTMFTGEFVVDLMDPNHDGKLTFAEMTSSGTEFSDMIAANLQADAAINLDLAASFGGNTAFPRVLAEFHLLWHFDLINGAGDPQISITDIYLDLGSFLSDFLGPILKEIQKVTEPLQPIIDVVTARLPVLSDLAGETVTLLTLAEIFGLLEPSTVDFIDSVIQVINLINDLDGLGEGSILIPFGSFSLLEDESGNRTNIAVLQEAASMAGDQLASAIESAGTAEGTSSTYQHQASGFAGDVSSLSNFSIPIFDNPSELFGLFTGTPVRLVEWRMPTFKFEFTYIQKIPIYPPLYAQFGGSIGATINIGFGYDTFGIQKFIESEDKNPIDLLDGFYVIDFDAQGHEQPELTLTGEIFAGAEIDLLIVSAGVRGGITATIEFDLNDVNDDGRVRVSEIIANAQQDPRCIFDIHGEIGLFLEAFLKVDLFFFSIDKTWRFAEITLFEFDITCPVPVLATKDGAGVLTLNMGSMASAREEIDTNDNAETFVVRHLDGNDTSEQVEVQWSSWKQSFEGVTKILVLDAGKGDDVIDLRGVMVDCEVHGGVGNDTIYLSDGSGSSAFGDDGNDTLTASMESAATLATLHGGPGNDLLTAGTTAITIYGDAGNDTITGSPDNDTLYGDDGTGTAADGADTIDAGEGDDVADGGMGNDTIEGGEGDDWLLGQGGNDTLRGSRGDDVLDGGDSDDRLYGSSGNDLLIGGEGDDWANGHGGIDLLIGEGVSTINGLPVTLINLPVIRMALAAIPDAGITVDGLTGGDVTNPNPITGNDLLIGGGNVDVLFGGPGNDFLYGGNFLNNGETDVIEEDANDFFDGGPGNDTIFGDDAMGRTGDRDTGIAIHGAIFFDLNKNGIKDGEETGFGGITVNLYRNDGVPIADTKTESDGSYQFTGLDPDLYYMTFSTVAGLNFIAPQAGGAPNAEAADNDSDVDGSGKTPDFELTFDETESSVTAGYEGDPIVSISNISVNEGDEGQTAAVLTVTLSGPQVFLTSVDYATADGTAEVTNGDYVAAAGRLEFGPGETSKTITLYVNGDTTYEEHQQFQLTLSNPSAGIKLQTSPTTTVLVTIINDDPIPAISIADYVPPSTLQPDGQRVYNAGEGDTATFVVSLSNPSQFTIKVRYLVDSPYTFAGLDPENPGRPFPLFPDGDFTIPATTTVVFLPGETRKTIPVPLHDDAGNPIDEWDEHFFVDLYNPEYARIEDGRGYGIIPDDDPEVSVSIVPALPVVGDPFRTQVAEGSGSTLVTVPLIISLDKPSGKQVTVTYATSPGTAVETVYSQDAMLGNDLPDYIPFPSSTTPESDLDVVFAPGEQTKIVYVTIQGDNLVEGDEMFFVNLISADNAVIARTPSTESNHVTVVIQDDDTVPDADAGPWAIRFSDTTYTVQEPDTGDTTAFITLLRTPGSSHAIAVFFTTDGTATAGLDYDKIFRQVVVFGEHELSKTIGITIHSDNVSEGEETVLLSLRNPTGGKVRASPDTAVLRIEDEDVPALSIDPPGFLVFDPSIPGIIFQPGIVEGNPSPQSSTAFDVHLTKPAPPGGVFVDWETVSLTARVGSDFTGASGTLFIPYLGTGGTINIAVTQDTVSELTERFAVRLKNPVRASLQPEDSVALAPIYDDDGRAVEGQVFYDTNGNGFLDLGEKGIEDVQVTISYSQFGVTQTVTVPTDSMGKYMTSVMLGQVSIAVDGTTVKSPYQKGAGPLALLLWSGAYETTTDNEVQSEEFDGVVGISPFGPVGYQNSFSLTLPSDADDVGRGGTDDTIFGGPGNDLIDAGAGDDHVVGGHWQTATDSNMPVNQAAYKAVVVVVTDDTNLPLVYGLPGGTTLHSIYDEGPIFAVTPEIFGGQISGDIWQDINGNDSQLNSIFPTLTFDPLFTGEVLVHLLDGSGNPINTVVTTTGAYQFLNLYVDPDHPAVESKYIVEFELPTGFKFVQPNIGDGNPAVDASSLDSDAEFVNRTRKLAISGNDPTKTGIDAGVIPSSTIPTANGLAFEFDQGTYSVSEKDGFIEIAVVRGNSYFDQSVLIRTTDGTGPEGAVSTPPATRNFTAVNRLLYFGVGETYKFVRIPVHDRGLGICDFRYFTVTMHDPTGRRLDDATVYIVGQGNPTITDDDTITGGNDWDIILGDSASIPGYAVVDEYAQIGLREHLGDIQRFGGPGDDIIDGSGGADYLDGQLGDDILAGGDTVDIVVGGLGDDQITVEQGNDDIQGDHGTDTVISRRAVPGTTLTPSTLTHLRSDGTVLNTHTMHDVFEVARLFGDGQRNTFNLNSWDSSAFVSGGGNTDTLLVNKDSNMILRDATLLEQLISLFLFDFAKDASLSLPNGSTYHLASLENIRLTGGDGDNTLDASAYSRPVTFVGGAGNDMLIGGSAGDTFIFLADTPLGTDTVTGNGGRDTLTFVDTYLDLFTTAPVVVDLDDHALQVVNASLSLILTDDLENATGGHGDDTLKGNSLDNVLLGGEGDDTLQGRGGNETYAFDADLLWGTERIIEDPLGGNDTLDFSATTSFSVSVNLSITGAQVVNPNLTLIVQDSMGGEGEIENVYGGSRNDVLRGNTFANILHGGPGADLLDGKSGDDLLDGGPGNDTLDGGAGNNDRIDITADTNFTLTDTSLQRGTGEIDSLENIEVAYLTGGPGANTFNLTGWTGSGKLDGADAAGDPRVDTVIVNADATFTLSDTMLTVSTMSGPIQLVAPTIDVVMLTDGPGSHTLDASAFHGRTFLTGNEGDDVLIGGAGADVLRGGLGNDTLTGNRGNDLLDGGTGTDALVESLAAATWNVNFVVQNISLLTVQVDPVPTPVDDTITEFDVLQGIESADITGGAGNDSFDVSHWTAGAASVHGGPGTNQVIAQGVDPDPADPAHAGITLTLTDTAVTFTGGAGTITLDSIQAARLTGTADNDLLDASAFTGAALLDGGDGNDELRGGPALNALLGGAGNDRFVFRTDGTLDRDIIVGGDGIDTLDFSGVAAPLTVNLATLASVQTVIAGELELFLTSLTAPPAEEIENVIGGSGADTITGNGLNNELTGGPGADIIAGGGGTDTIVETADADMTLTNASLDIGGVVDMLSSIEAARLTGGAGANILNAVAFSHPALLMGLGGADTLIGGTSSDVLIGGPGDDILRGGTGDDRYVFDVDEVLGNDTVDELPGPANGIDTLDFTATETVGVIVDLSSTSPQPAHVTNLTLTLTSNAGVENLYGGAQADTLTGNSLDNQIWGGAGSDVISGGDGTADRIIEIRDLNFILTDTALRLETPGMVLVEQDTLSGIERALLAGGAGDNLLDASAFTLGPVMLFGLDGNDTLLGGYGDDDLRGGNGDDLLYGGGGADEVRGEAGNDMLSGSGAVDLLVGADGNDALRGGTGNDTYLFDKTFFQGTDTVFEFLNEGYLDVLQGAGLAGIVIDLNSGAMQPAGPNLTVVLGGTLGAVEDSF